MTSKDTGTSLPARLTAVERKVAQLAGYHQEEEAQGGTDVANRALCRAPQVKKRAFEGPMDPNRLRLIRTNEKKWLNGTVLH